MSHSRTYDKTKPLNTELLGYGDDYIRNALEDIEERLILDHNMEDIIDTSLPTADGYHKKVTMPALSADPTVLSVSQAMTSISNATPAVVTKASHGYSSGDAIKFTTTGVLPAGLLTTVVYYVHKLTGDDTFNLCLTYADAIAGTNKVATTDAGSGTHTAVKYLCGIVYAKADGLYFINAAGSVKII